MTSQKNNMEESLIDANTDLHATHFFLYKGKQYLFNMKLFKCFSQYFQKNKQMFKGKSNIELVDESEPDSEYSESSINDFINFCQSKQITLNKTNVLPLHKLAKKYEVPSLVNATNKFISVHKKDVVLELLLLGQDADDTDNHEYEDMISINLPEYLTDQRLLSLRLPVLHRILSKYSQKNSLKTDPEERSKFIEFLFKCLDHFGREASVLFECVDFGSNSGTFLNRLMKEYSEKFDFHFINDQQLRTIYDLEGEIIQRAANLRETENATANDIQFLKQKIDQFQSENESLKSQVERAIMDKDAQIQQRVDDLKRENEAAIRQAEASFDRQRDELKATIAALTEKVEKLKGDLVDQINKQTAEMKNPKVSCMLLSESDPRGALVWCGPELTLTGSGFPNIKNPVSNLTKYDDSFYYNFYDGTPNSESHTYITADFGPSKRIDLHSYLIWSLDYYPKSWRIEGSNDGSVWTPLDKRENDSNLNDSHKQHHFVCQLSRTGDESNRYRYIRYAQLDCHYSNRYYIDFSFFELYGDIFRNY